MASFDGIGKPSYLCPMNRKMGDGVLAALIAQGEHQQQDFKFGITDSRKIARSLVAFANTDGGRLLIGVKDNGAVVGVSSEEEFYMIESAASIFSIPEIRFSSLKHVEQGKTVLEIQVSPSANKPHYVKEMNNQLLAWLRHNDQNVQASPVRIAVWNKERLKSGNLVRITDAEHQLFEILGRLGRVTLDQYVSLTGLDPLVATDTLANLVVFGNLSMELDANGEYFA